MNVACGYQCLFIDVPYGSREYKGAGRWRWRFNQSVDFQGGNWGCVACGEWERGAEEGRQVRTVGIHN